MTLIVYVFSKKQTAREVVRQMRKKPRFRTPVDSQHVKEAKTLVKSTLEYLHQISSSLWAKLTWKMSLLVISELVGHFAFADFAANIRMTFIAYVFKQYGLQKMWLDKCLKNPVQKHRLAVSMLNTISHLEFMSYIKLPLRRNLSYISQKLPPSYQTALNLWLTYRLRLHIAMYIAYEI